MSDESAVSAPVSASSRGELQDFLTSNAPVLSIAAFFVLVCLVFAVITDSFLTQVNLLNLLRQSAPILITATAMTFVITTGGIDLSVGSNLALVNALAAIALAAGIPWPVVVPPDAPARRGDRCGAGLFRRL